MMRPWTICTRRSAAYDAVVMRHHHDRGAVSYRGLLEQPDDIHRRFPVERCGRLVGEDQSRAIDERAANRDPLPLAAERNLGL